MARFKSLAAAGSAMGGHTGRPDDGMQGMTLIERLAGALRLPYLWASLLLGLLAGPPGYLVVHTLDSGSLDQARRSFFQGLAPGGPWPQIVSLALWTLHAVYAFWIIRYVRVRVAAAAPGIAPLVPGGSDRYRAVFGRPDRLLPPLLLAVVVALLFQDLIAGTWQDSGPLGRIYVVLRWLLLGLAYGTATWVYLNALWGLVRLGRLPLSLDLFHRDGRMGARGIGALSLSITFAYAIFFTILGLIALLGPVLTQLRILLAVLVALSAILFFWPLWAVHDQMAAAKSEQEQAIRERLMRAALRGDDPGSVLLPEPLLASVAELKRDLSDLKTVLALDVAERKLAGTSTWPLDLAILGKLAALVLPILTALLSDLLIKTLLPD